MEPKTGKRFSSLTAFIKANIRRIVIIIIAAILAQVAGIPIPSSAYPTNTLYPISFLPLLFIAGGGGLVGLTGYAIGATAGDLVRLGFSFTLILFDLIVFGSAGWFTGIALKSRSGIGQVILTLIATIITGLTIVFLSPIGANIGRGVYYSTLTNQYLYGWLPFFIVPSAILSYWMGRIRDQISKLTGTSQEKKPAEKK